MRHARLLFIAITALAACGAPGVRPATRPASDGDEATAAQVRAELLHAWNGYKRYAWGHDALRPLSRGHHDWYSTSLLMTPVDALDTLMLAGLAEEARQARELITARLSFDHDMEVRVFEVTIRLLGGLLSGYELSSDDRLLRLAEDLGRRLLPAFASPTGMPYQYVNLRSGKGRGARSNPAEVGTLLLELGTLSRHTKNPVYGERAKRALRALYARRSPLGLVGQELDVETGRWTNPASHVGGAIDSYYEYLLKCALLFDDRECEQMWRESLRAVNARVADRTPAGLWYGRVDMTSGRRLATRFGALEAFWPGLLALAGDVPHAAELQESCFRMWRVAGVEPEEIDYTTMRVVNARYPLRPEIIESAYYLHRATGRPRYREMGRTFLADLRRHCRTADGYAALADVVTKRKADEMESFFLAETLKYLYLLFASSDRLDLERVVLNTEAHPFRKHREPRTSR
jgi:mannosidase alpha-like ER degradation enhancer 2